MKNYFIKIFNTYSKIHNNNALILEIAQLETQSILLVKIYYWHKIYSKFILQIKCMGKACAFFI